MIVKRSTRFSSLCWFSSEKPVEPLADRFMFRRFLRKPERRLADVFVERRGVFSFHRNRRFDDGAATRRRQDKVRGASLLNVIGAGYGDFDGATVEVEHYCLHFVFLWLRGFYCIYIPGV
jgi:hypothetical protein